MTALNNILVVLLFLLVIAITLFVLQHYKVFSFTIFPETWFYVDEQLSDHLGSESSSVPPPPPTVDPTPPTTDEIVPVVPPPPPRPKYLGCYRDAGWIENPLGRVLPVYGGVKNLAGCNDVAKTAGSKYFGLQFFEENAGTAIDTAQCWIDGQNRNPYDRDGKLNETECPVLGTADYGRGGSWTNAIYETI